MVDVARYLALWWLPAGMDCRATLAMTGVWVLALRWLPAAMDCGAALAMTGGFFASVALASCGDGLPSYARNDGGFALTVQGMLIVSFFPPTTG
jgi:hypothetical protein